MALGNGVYVTKGIAQISEGADRLAHCLQRSTAAMQQDHEVSLEY